jgi:DNA-3-methyladenine glycosylase
MPSPLAAAPTIEALAKARLPASFFHRDVLVVARELIGCALVHRRRAGMIVETEAYRGPDDAASHARFGPTARTSVMFGPGGISYVYLCYGIHQMFNIVTGGEGEGQAVLIRAVAPLAGLPDDPAVGRGPGKVTTALALDRRHDRRDLARGALFVAAHATAPAIATGPRIGVAYAGEWAARPWRFWWNGHPAVSRVPGEKRAPREPDKPPSRT